MYIGKDGWFESFKGSEECPVRPDHTVPHVMGWPNRTWNSLPRHVNVRCRKSPLNKLIRGMTENECRCDKPVLPATARGPVLQYDASVPEAGLVLPKIRNKINLPYPFAPSVRIIASAVAGIHACP